MAKAKEEVEVEDTKSSGGSSKLIVIILAVLLVVVIGVGVALFFLMGDKPAPATAEGEKGAPAVEEVQVPKTPLYIPLHPAFLVNFEDQSSASHLQLEAQAMTYDDKVEAAMKTHMPKIRNDLILLFGSQKYEELNTVKGKRELSKKSIEVISKALKDAGEPDKVEAFLFTSFVMQ